MMLAATVIAVVVLGYLIFITVRSIRDKRDTSRSVWREFGLGLSLMIMFFASWVGQAITEWQVFTDEQRSHGEEPEVGDFMSQFASSTLENWQSEFLQLFSFVTLAALFIHRGSAESRDSDDRMEQMLKEIKAKLDA